MPVEIPFFESGNKTLEFEGDGHRLSVLIDHLPALEIFWWGDIPGGGFGYPFEDRPDDPAGLACVPGENAVVYRKPYVDDQRRRDIFSYRVSVGEDGLLELKWQSGSRPVSLWFVVHRHRGKALLFGESRFAESPADRLATLPYQESAVRVAGDFVHMPDDPARRVVLRLGGMTGRAAERRETVQPGDVEQFHFTFQQEGGSPEGNILVDLGESPVVAENVHPAVGGIDFWREDAMHVPLSPVRNLFPNPSFEQGLRYWTWMRGGALHTPGEARRYEVAPMGKFGRHALLVRNSQPASSGLRSFPLSLETGRRYTVSFWAKTIEGTASVRMGLASANKAGRFDPWEELSSPGAQCDAVPEWRRFSRIFTADSGGVSLLLAVYGDDVLVDGVQLEVGTEATDFIAPPLESRLVSPRLDNDFQPAESYDAGLDFVGEPGVTARVGITVSNAFRETVYADGVDVAIGPKGSLHVPLALDSRAMGEGVFVLRVECSAPGVEPYSEYHRFSVMTPLDNVHSTKDLFGANHVFSQIDRGGDLAAKYRDWGFGSTSWGYSPDEEGGGTAAAYEKRYGIANLGHTYIEKEAAALGRPSPEMWDDYFSWTRVTPEMERQVEERAFRHASRCDPALATVWAFGNEEESGSGLIARGLFDEHFRLVAALDRGVRRAIPDAVVLPTNGTAGMDTTSWKATLRRPAGAATGIAASLSILTAISTAARSGEAISMWRRNGCSNSCGGSATVRRRRFISPSFSTFPIPAFQSGGATGAMTITTPAAPATISATANFSRPPPPRGPGSLCSNTGPGCARATAGCPGRSSICTCRRSCCARRPIPWGVFSPTPATTPMFVREVRFGDMSTRLGTEPESPPCGPSITMWKTA